MRTNPINGQLDVLGVVGNKYEPMQNEASCALLDALTGESGAVYETAGALRGGREPFVTMKLPEAMVFDGRDGSKGPHRVLPRSAQLPRRLSPPVRDAEAPKLG